MNFLNHTPFPAQSFRSFNRDGTPGHVVVLRQTLDFSSGSLRYADAQAPLCEADDHFSDGTRSGVRQESDFCHAKPRCDILVNALAHAPADKPASRFAVRLAVRKPATPAPLPPRPQGLNQFDDAAPAVMERWRQTVRHAEAHPVPGASLVHKTLIVSGPRQFRKRAAAVRVAQQLIRLATLGLLRLNPWTLTQASEAVTLPLSDDRCYGGTCRIEAGEPAASRLHAVRAVAAPDSGQTTPSQPVPHRVCEANPHGAGFADQAYLDATRTCAVTAPAVGHAGALLDARLFWRMLQAKPIRTKPGRPDPFEPAGFGVRRKSHPARRALAGTVDQAFIDSDLAWPPDFDDAFWNCAPADQKTGFLRGDETLELVNLCRPDTPCVVRDARGNAWLTLTLPRDECFVLCRLHDGTLIEQALMLDIVLIEPEQHCVSLVWRGMLLHDLGASMRIAEVRMRSLDEGDIARNWPNSIDRFPKVMFLKHVFHASFSGYWPEKALTWLKADPSVQKYFSCELEQFVNSKVMPQGVRQRAKKILQSLWPMNGQT